MRRPWGAIGVQAPRRSSAVRRIRPSDRRCGRSVSVVGPTVSRSAREFQACIFRIVETDYRGTSGEERNGPIGGRIARGPRGCHDACMETPVSTKIHPNGRRPHRRRGHRNRCPRATRPEAAPGSCTSTRVLFFPRSAHRPHAADRVLPALARFAPSHPYEWMRRRRDSRRSWRSTAASTNDASVARSTATTTSGTPMSRRS